MSDALLPYYNRELNAVRRLAADFASAHPIGPPPPKVLAPLPVRRETKLCLHSLIDTANFISPRIALNQFRLA